MPTDPEKLAMLERAYALEVVRKAARQVADCLTALEVRPLEPLAEEKMRAKLAGARETYNAAVIDLTTIVSAPVPAARSAHGALFDETVTMARG